ncbi:MAG: FAD:protein FMN transferase [Phycisphaerae bacterium]|nr:FAD:protein FMN transferase [Phycisphaerae bacterium]
MNERRPEPPSTPCSLPGNLAVQRFTHRAMACEWGLFIHGQLADYADQVARAVFAEIDRVEQELSRFIPSSDIARLNALPGGRPLKIGIEAFECLELAEQVRSDTGGAFDITFASPSAPSNPPRLKLNRSTHTVTKSADTVQLDLGGIGKGYAIDQTMQLLAEWGVDCGLVHSGQSTLRAIGSPDQSQGWSIALRDPRDHTRTPRCVDLSGGALSGSGALLHGQHIIDPRTGQPAAGPLGTWSMAPSSALADALSTAFMVLGVAGTRDYCQRHPDITAMILDEGAAASLQVLGHV